MRQSETLFHPTEEPREDTTPVVENGGYIHLAGAAAEDAELFFANGEDSDGNPDNPANPNSRAYNPQLGDLDEPMVDGVNGIQITELEQVADLQPESERPHPEAS